MVTAVLCMGTELFFVAAPVRAAGAFFAVFPVFAVFSAMIALLVGGLGLPPAV